MSKSKKQNGNGKTPERKELEHWQQYLENQGIEGEDHPYAETMKILREAAEESEKPQDDKEGL